MFSIIWSKKHAYDRKGCSNVMSDDQFNPDLASAGSESPVILRKKRIAPAGSSNDAASSEGGDSPPRDVEFEAALHVQAEDESAAREKLFRPLIQASSMPWQRSTHSFASVVTPTFT